MTATAARPDNAGGSAATSAGIGLSGLERVYTGEMEEGIDF